MIFYNRQLFIICSYCYNQYYCSNIITYNVNLFYKLNMYIVFDDQTLLARTNHVDCKHQQ